YLLYTHPPISTLFPYTTLFRSQFQQIRPFRPCAPGNDDPHMRRQQLDQPFHENVDLKHIIDEVKIIDDDDKRFSDFAQFINEKRSEEHTSELQSRENLVCRLLL